MPYQDIDPTRLPRLDIGQMPGEDLVVFEIEGEGRTAIVNKKQEPREGDEVIIVDTEGIRREVYSGQSNVHGVITSYY